MGVIAGRRHAEYKHVSEQDLSCLCLFIVLGGGMRHGAKAGILGRGDKAAAAHTRTPLGYAAYPEACWRYETREAKTPPVTEYPSDAGTHTTRICRQRGVTETRGPYPKQNTRPDPAHGRDKTCSTLISSIDIDPVHGGRSRLHTAHDIVSLSSRDRALPLVCG